MQQQKKQIPPELQALVDKYNNAEKGQWFLTSYVFFWHKFPMDCHFDGRNKGFDRKTRPVWHAAKWKQHGESGPFWYTDPMRAQIQKKSNMFQTSLASLIFARQYRSWLFSMSMTQYTKRLAPLWLRKIWKIASQTWRVGLNSSNAPCAYTYIYIWLPSAETRRHGQLYEFTLLGSFSHALPTHLVEKPLTQTWRQPKRKNKK